MYVLPNGWQKSIFDVFYLKGRLCPRNCNDIEANRQVYFESLNVCISRDDDVSDFPVGNGFFWPAKLVAPAGFYFYYYQFTVLLRYDVQFPIA